MVSYIQVATHREDLHPWFVNGASSLAFWAEVAIFGGAGGGAWLRALENTYRL